VVSRTHRGPSGKSTKHTLAQCNQQSRSSDRHRRPADGDFANIHLPRTGRRAFIGVKHNLLSVGQDIRPTRRVQVIPAPRHQQRPPALRVGTHNIRRRRIRRIIVRPSEAIRRKKENVDAFATPNQTGGLDERAVGVRAVEDLCRAAARGDAVGFHGLDHDGRGGEGGDAVVAVAAVADAVAVDLVDYVDGAVGVGEACWIDGSSLAIGWAGKRCVCNVYHA